ncbi:uncharacterized protein AB9X84_014426 isoform 2-T2 [Acanthopagrus schlegelii]
MLAVVFPLLLLLAPILGQRPQLLHVAVGGSVLIPCSLPGYPHNLKWFYWQEDEYLVFHWDGGKTIPVQNNKYKDRCQVFNSEFNSGNISIRLDNISLEDDEKTFFAYVKFYDEQKKVFKHPEERCRSMLQVSAPYQDLVLTVNHTTNSATCSARGGYPAAQVSWKGLNRSSDEELDLQDAETFLQPDPTEKTFSFTNSVNVTGLKSVTCVVYNPHSHETITRTEKIDTEEGEQKYLLPIKIIAPVVIIALIAISCVVLQKSPVMLAVVFPLLLLLAPILGQRPQLLHVAVGGSVLIPCSLPGYPHNLKWFYWQEDEYLVFHWDGGKTIPVQNNKYKDRKKSSNTLKNGADPCCRFQDLVLTVNHTTNSATCSARGGYPAAQVSWKGLNRSSDEELDLQDAETFLQPDPTEKTFSFTSSVNVTGLKSVTCVVYNPHSNKTITGTEKIDTEEGEQKYLLPIKIIAPVVIIVLIAISCVVLQKSIFAGPQDQRKDEEGARESTQPSVPGSPVS